MVSVCEFTNYDLSTNKIFNVMLNVKQKFCINQHYLMMFCQIKREEIFLDGPDILPGNSFWIISITLFLTLYNLQYYHCQTLASLARQKDMELDFASQSYSLL